MSSESLIKELLLQAILLIHLRNVEICPFEANVFTDVDFIPSEWRTSRRNTEPASQKKTFPFALSEEQIRRKFQPVNKYSDLPKKLEIKE